MIDMIDKAGAPTLFPMEDAREEAREARPKMRSGGSGNPIVFHDYESFIKKFTEKPKTTDECWTPRDVYEAVVKRLGEEGMKDKNDK